MEPRKRILIVDDQSDLRKLVRMTLAPLDCDLKETDNGTEALRLMRTLRPDVVILDVMLPGGADGYQVCRAIKADPATRAACVIILSARGQRWDIEEGKRAEADHYLVKPFSPLALMDLVQRSGRETPPA